MKIKDQVYEILIREHHLDTFGHVNHAEYLRIMEEARWEMITANGYGLKEVQRLGVGPVILGVNIRYTKELTLRDRARIVTRYLSTDKKISRLRQEIYNQNNELCAEAEITYGIMDTNARKLISPPPEWLSAVGVETLDTPSKSSTAT